MGILITSDGKSDSEVNSRIAPAKIVFQKIRTVLAKKKKYVRGYETPGPSV